MLRLTLRNGDKVEIPNETLDYYKETWEEMMAKAVERGLSREEAKAHEVIKVEEMED